MADAFAQNETSTNTNNVEIQNIQVEPSTIKVGDTLKITATLVNNSTNQIFLSYGVCEGKFSVIFDNHVAVSKKSVPCVLMAIEQRLDPGTKTTGTSPGSFPPHGTPTVTYTANATGIANATVTFSYSDSGIEKTISKSFLFTINDNDTKIKTVNNAVLSPLKQFQSGTAASKVACNQGFQLILKRENTSPACVTPDTAQILIERGWGFMRGVQTFFPLGNIENDTTQPLIPPSQLPHLPLGNLPVNKTVLAFSKIPNWNKKFVCEKYTGSAIQITAEISNALKFSGTVTDPKGVIHDILPIALNNTQMQIQFSASTSDPDGSYVVAFKVVNGSNTSNVNFYCWGSMVENGTTYPGLHPLPP